MNYTPQELGMLWAWACSPLEERERVALIRSAKDPAALVNSTERERELKALLARLERENAFALTLASEDYPACLKVPDAPVVLYGTGNRALLRSRKLCIVGSRITPPWAEKLGKNIAEELSAHFTIVTGIAEGGDSAAIQGALASGNLISVLPCGLDECYPAAHASVKRKIAEKGLLLTEYPFGTKTAKYVFRARNRILAGLSEGVLVLSAGAKSGARITASRAADYGRDVFALPYNAGVASGEGCNGLIKEGAYLVTSAQDILNVYGIASAAREEETLPEGEARLVAILREAGELHAAELASRANMRIFEAAALLSSLEIKGRVVKSGGNRYSIV